jgi:hypothetical protein
MRVVDPSGATRGELPADATLEQALALAWNLGPRDDFLVTAEDSHRWSLCIYSPERVPVTTPLGIRTGYTAPQDHAKARAAMIEAAWLDLVDEGWSLVR